MAGGLRVLQLLVSTQPGGGPRHVLDLVLGLQALGWRAVVAGPRDGAMFDHFGQAGVDVVELRTDRLRPATVLRLSRLVRARDIRLIHSHGKGAGVYGRLVARMHGLPAVHTFHGIHFEGYRAAARVAYLAIERGLARWTRIVINVSRAQEREGIALRLFTPTQSRVVRNGIDAAGLTATALDRRNARLALGLTPSAPVVGCAARFDPVKQLDVLLEAVAGIKDDTVRVVLVGDGPETPRLVELARTLGLASRALFPGEVVDAAKLFPAFDVYAAPSRKEGLPLAVLEAMALGLPVVASDIAAHREVLGDSAGLVDASPPAVAAVLGTLLADPGQRARLGAENRARVRSEFDVKGMVRRVDAIYREVLPLE